MERVAFLVEETGARLGCLLNPESVVLRRRAGVRTSQSVGGLVTGTELSDDPLLFTGGGETELELDLLFDVALAGSSVTTGDVRQLTLPLWDLAENHTQSGSYGTTPLVRFVWGKHWNIPGVVIAVAERLEYFTPEGVPRRSWLRMRIRRVSETKTTLREGKVGADISQSMRSTQALPRQPTNSGMVHGITGGAPSNLPTDVASALSTDVASVSDERLDQLAELYYGDANLWRLIAAFNDLADPLRVTSGELLQLPPLPNAGGTA